MVSNEMILDYLKDHPNSTAADLHTHFNISSSIVFAKLNALVEKEEITVTTMVRDNGRKVRHYRLAKKSIKEEVEEAMIEVKEAAAMLPFTIKNTMPSLDTLITEAAHNIAQRMLEQIKQEIMMGLEDLVLEVAPKITRDGFLNKAPKEKVTKPKVLITGLLSHQAGIISSEFYEFFDLDFWNDRTGNSTEQLKSMAKRADVILYHKNHASHNHQEIIKSVGGNIKIINGGISSMKDALTDLYVNGVK